MLCCRLIDDNDQILAQETLSAPDLDCIVLDPNMPDPEGRPTPASFRPPGPVVFQVRLPILPHARIMKIYRVTGGSRPGLRDEPVGELIATIQLPE